MSVVEELANEVGLTQACHALGFSRATFYRRHQVNSAKKTRNKPDRALSGEEKEAVLEVLHSERFIDCSPREIWAQLLDEGIYQCSVRTMYRILEENGEVRERRAQLRHPEYKKPELLAQSPNEVWSWDITKLKGPVKWTYYQLYVIIDIYSRYVVGWMITERESGELASLLVEETYRKQGVMPEQVHLHADRGPAMTSKDLALLLAELGITKSHSRPYVSDDNPYSESQFKTLKYRPEFPERFGSIEDARAFCRVFFAWYNQEHRHVGIGLLTPEMVHYGQSKKILAQRQAVLSVAYEAHPERFVRRPPTPPQLPDAVWINPPKIRETAVRGAVESQNGEVAVTCQKRKQHKLSREQENPSLQPTEPSLNIEPPVLIDV